MVLIPNPVYRLLRNRTLTKIIFVFIATICSVSAYSQVWVEIGMPNTVINRWDGAKFYQGFGAYGHIGYRMKSFHPGIRLYRAPGSIPSQVENGIGLSVSYLPKIEKIPWAAFELGLYSMYLVKNDSDNSLYDRKTVIGCGELGIGFRLTEQIIVRTSVSVGYGKPGYTASNTKADNWIAFYPYLLSLGLRYNFNP